MYTSMIEALSQGITVPDYYVRSRYDTNKSSQNESLKEEDEDSEADLEGEEEIEEIIEARDQHIERAF